jgi:hypothetical protein
VVAATEEKGKTFDDEVRLDTFFRWIWRGKWLIIVLIVGASGLAALTGVRQPVVHYAAALIEVGRVWGKPLKDIYITVETANSPGFIQEVAAKTGVKPGHLARSVQVSAVESGVPHSIYAILIRVTAKTEDADESVRLADAVAEEIVARHAKLFDEAIAPHLERQSRLEQRLKEIGSSPSDREFAVKLESELEEVKANNTSPTTTEKTHLVEKVVPGRVERPEIWRGAATAGLIAAFVGVAMACMLGYFKSSRRENL